MKSISLIIIFLLAPLFANAGLDGSGYRDCSTHISDREQFSLTLQDVSDAFNVRPDQLFAIDSYFNIGLSALEKEKNILGDGERGSYKVNLVIEHKCKSADGGIKLTLNAPSQFKKVYRDKLLGNFEKELVDTDVNQSVLSDRIELDGATIKVLIDLTEASLPDLMRKGRFSKNIRVSIFNKITGLHIEGYNKL